MPAKHASYFNPAWIQPSDQTLNVDVCIYGGNAAGVVAAIKAIRLGHHAVLLHPGLHLGGMTTGGLGWTDYGHKHVIGGMARRFYRDLGESIGIEGEHWQFWPSSAAAVIDAMVKNAGLDVRCGAYLNHVEMDGRRIKTLALLGGLRVRARQYIDCTYEGDLMAAAGVSHATGRESNTTYNETINGIQVREKHQFVPADVSPFVVENDPASGLLPFVEARDLRQVQGQADHKIQAYNFRICMTDDPELKIDWQRPDDYNPLWYELAARWYGDESRVAGEQYNLMIQSPPRADGFQPLMKFDVLPRLTANGFQKTDTNNNGPVNTDFIGASHAWPTADYAVRELIFQQHVSYMHGFYWFMSNDPRVPDRLRSAFAHWGLPSDEFIDTGHWPHQLYIREGRRMVGDYVITEHDCTGAARAEDSVGMGSYTMDSHNCSRFVANVDGKPVVMNEGDVQLRPAGPYPISYRAVTPPRGECENLLVPVCFSASHIAYGSARMEPVFMVLGESVACAASLAITNGVAVQDVRYDSLRSMLDAADQVLEAGVVASA